MQGLVTSLNSDRVQCLTGAAVLIPQDWYKAMLEKAIERQAVYSYCEYLTGVWGVV